MSISTNDELLAKSQVFGPLKLKSTEEKRDNLREMFEKYAQQRGWDPLVASNWYSVTFQEFAAEKKVFSFHCFFSILVPFFPVRQVLPFAF